MEGETARIAASSIEPTGVGGPAELSAAYVGPARKAVLRLDEKFDPRWRLTIDGLPADEADHVEVDGHFNGWFIDLKPSSELQAAFALQTPYRWIQIANLASLIAAAVADWWPTRLLPVGRD